MEKNELYPNHVCAQIPNQRSEVYTINESNGWDLDCIGQYLKVLASESGSVARKTLCIPRENVSLKLIDPCVWRTHVSPSPPSFRGDGAGEREAVNPERAPYVYPPTPHLHLILIPYTAGMRRDAPQLSCYPSVSEGYG